MKSVFISTATNSHRSKHSVKTWSLSWIFFTSVMLSASEKGRVPMFLHVVAWLILEDSLASFWSTVLPLHLQLLMHSGQDFLGGRELIFRNLKKISWSTTSLVMWVMRLSLFTVIRYSSVLFVSNFTNLGFTSS